jgi:hypothetical protein
LLPQRQALLVFLNIRVELAAVEAFTELVWLPVLVRQALNLAVAVAVGLPPTTALPLALVALVALAWSSSFATNHSHDH